MPTSHPWTWFELADILLPRPLGVPLSSRDYFTGLCPGCLPRSHCSFKSMEQTKKMSRKQILRTKDGLMWKGQGGKGLTCPCSSKSTALRTQRHLRPATGQLCLIHALPSQHLYFLNSFTEIPFTCPSAHPLKRLLVFRWLLVFSELRIQPHSQFFRHFHHPQKKPVPLAIAPNPPAPGDH